MIKVDTGVETEREMKTKWTREKLGNESKEKAREYSYLKLTGLNKHFWT